MSRIYLTISGVVSVIVAVLFILIIRNEQKFKLSEDYQLIPDGLVLPKGCDIRIDMQTGFTWARKKPSINKSDLIVSEDADAIKEENVEGGRAAKPFPEYKNITKSRIQSRVSGDQMNLIESALKSLELESSWEYLEGEGPAMEIGYAILEAKNFDNLRNYLQNSDEKALKLMAICLQNNPLAVEKILELKVHLNELKNLLKRESMTKSAFKILLRIVESIGQVEFIEMNMDSIKRHFEEHKDQDLIERHGEMLSISK